MKYLFLPVLALLTFSSCNKKTKPVVQANFVDSVMQAYTGSAFLKLNAAELKFWKDRMHSMPEGYTNEQQYAGNLAARYQLTGNFADLKSADSMMLAMNVETKATEPAMLRTLGRLAILQHKFHQADDYVRKAIELGSEKYASLLMKYDVAFELGNYNLATNTLKEVESTNEYGYFFRQARQFHYLGEHDSSIIAMKKALQIAGNNKNLQQITLSNIGDLQLHAANAEEAYYAYKQSLQLDPADMHSMMGIGWIALIYDKNAALAEKIFRFADTTIQTPDPLLKLSYTATQKGDTAQAIKYAIEFAKEAGDTMYGIMYSKYLIDIYSGLLNEPAKAKAIALNELKVRATPQTYSWYAYALFKNNEPALANEIYKKHISGKSLEGLELYYMGMMMDGMNKSYNAEQYFKAAYKNRYDLSPDKIAYLQATMD